MKVIERYIEPLNQTFRYIVGQNAQDNFNIIDDADENDYWFHVQNEPSCHVICDLSNVSIASMDKKQLRYLLKQGSIICKQHSKHKSLPNTTIVYTQIKNIAKTNIIGKVSITNSKVLIL
jgi:predicted ribosome quality control (RQC) complex YloA/Tae2 family protein